MTKKKDNRPRDGKLAPIADTEPVEHRNPHGRLAYVDTAVVPGAHGSPVPVLTEAQARAYPQALIDTDNPAGVNQLGPVPVVKLGKLAGFVFELDTQWTERLDRMAQTAGLTREAFLHSLLRRAWTGLDQRHRRGL